MNVSSAAPTPYDVLGVSPDSSKAAVREAFARSKRGRAERTAYDKLVDPDLRLEVDAFVVPPPPAAELPIWTEPDWLSLVDPQPIADRAAQAISEQIANMYLVDVPSGTPMPIWSPKPLASELATSLHTSSAMGFMHRDPKSAPNQQVASTFPVTKQASMNSATAALPRHKSYPSWPVVLLLVICSAVVLLVARNFFLGGGLRTTIVSTPTLIPQAGAITAGAAPVARFYIAQSGQEVTVRNDSEGFAEYYNWDMGDGTIFRVPNQGEFTHHYEQPGTYTIVLAAIGPDGADEAQNSVSVSIPATVLVQPTRQPIRTPQPTEILQPAPNAGFTLIQSGQEVTVHNDSVGLADNYNWDMGDGTIFSVSNHDEFTHHYERPGTYTIVLVAIGPGGSSTATNVVTISERKSAPPTVTQTNLLSTHTQTPGPATRTPAPTYTYTPTDLPRVAYTVISNQLINIRSCPQTTCEVVDTASPGEVLQVTGSTKGDPVSGIDDWLIVRVDGRDAYAHSALLREVEP